MEGQPPKQEVSWDVGVISLHIYTHIYIYILSSISVFPCVPLVCLLLAFSQETRKLETPNHEAHKMQTFAQSV